MSKPRKTKSVVSSLSRVPDAVRSAPNPLPQLTPENLAAYLDSFSRGYLRDTAILWHAIQWRDDRVGSDCAKRHKAVPRYGYKIVPNPGQDPDSPAVKRHVDAISFALENLTTTDVLDPSDRGGVIKLARQMMRAIGMQWQIHEILWQPRPEGLTLQTIAMPLWWFERTAGALRYLPQDLAIEGVPLEDDGWLITRGDGLMAPTSLLYLLKRMSLTDWCLYNGRVGPGIHGKTSAQPGTEQWTQLEDAIDNFNFDLKIVSQDGVSINPIEMALKGELPWPKMYDAMTKAITVLWRGGNLMSDSAGGPDQSGVTLQGSESLILEQDDGEMLSDAFNDYIVQPLIRYRFGEEPLAWIEWQTSAKPDRKGEIEVDRFLKEAGWQFTQEDLAERYHRTPPQDGDTVLTSSVPQPTPGTTSVSSVPSVLSAANFATPDPVDAAQQKLVAGAVDQTVAARDAMLQKWFSALEASLPEKASPAQYAAAVEAAIVRMPADLLTSENIAKLAGISEGAMGAAAVNGVTAETQEASK